MTKRDIMLQILTELFKEHPKEECEKIYSILEKKFPDVNGSRVLTSDEAENLLISLRKEMPGILASLVREGVLLEFARQKKYH